MIILIEVAYQKFARSDHPDTWIKRSTQFWKNQTKIFINFQTQMKRFTIQLICAKLNPYKNCDNHFKRGVIKKYIYMYIYIAIYTVYKCFNYSYYSDKPRQFLGP